MSTVSRFRLSHSEVAPRIVREPGDKPINHVRAVPGRSAYEIRFPVVEGYAFALRKNEIKADIEAMDTLRLEPEHTPTAVFVKAATGYQIGDITTLGPGGVLEKHNPRTIL